MPHAPTPRPTRSHPVSRRPVSRRPVSRRPVSRRPVSRRPVSQRLPFLSWLAPLLLASSLVACSDPQPALDRPAPGASTVATAQVPPAAPASGGTELPLAGGSGQLPAASAAAAETGRSTSGPREDRTAELQVRRLVVTHAVKAREPVGSQRSFVAGADARIYAFVEVANQDQAASAIYVAFVPPGAKRGPRIRLRVGPSARWRTWAFTRRARQPGTWTAVVRDGLGRELARTPFEVVAAPAQPARDAAAAPPHRGSRGRVSTHDGGRSSGRAGI